MASAGVRFFTSTNQEVYLSSSVHDCGGWGFGRRLKFEVATGVNKVASSLLVEPIDPSSGRVVKICSSKKNKKEHKGVVFRPKRPDIHTKGISTGCLSFYCKGDHHKGRTPDIEGCSAKEPASIQLRFTALYAKRDPVVVESNVFRIQARRPGNKSRGVTRYPSVEISGKKRRHSWTAAYGPVYAPLRQENPKRIKKESFVDSSSSSPGSSSESSSSSSDDDIQQTQKVSASKVLLSMKSLKINRSPKKNPVRLVFSCDSIRGNASPGLKAALHASAPSKIAYEQETSLDSDREHDIRNSTLSWGNEEEPDECEGGEIIKEKEKTKKIMPLAERRLLVEPTKKRKFLLDDDALDEFDNKPMRNVERYNLRLNIKSSPPPIARQTKTRRTWNSLSASLSSTNLDTGSTKPPQALSPDPNTSLVPMAAIVCPSMEPPPTTHVRRCNSAPDMKPCASFNGSSDCFISSPVAQLAKKRDLRDYGTTLNTSGRPNESKPKHPNTPTESPRKRFRLSASPDPTITAVTHTSATSATTTTSDTTTYTTSTIAITTPETNVESTDIELERVCDVTVTPLDSQINESALTENEERRDIWPHLQLLKEPLERSEPQTPVKLESADFSSPVFGSFDASSGSIFPVFSPYFQADCLPWPEHHNIRTLGGASDESLYEFWADPNEWLK